MDQIPQPRSNMINLFRQPLRTTPARQRRWQLRREQLQRSQEPMLSTQDATFANTNPQTDSALYRVMPAELRQSIFEYALSECEVEGTHYLPGIREQDLRNTAANALAPALQPGTFDPDTAHWHRPGSVCRTRITLSLLQTCKRTYLETSLLPARTKRFTLYHERGPPPRSRASRDAELAMKPEQLACVTALHVFCQQYALERAHDPFGMAAAWAPRVEALQHLTVTIRYGDWWNNEGDDPLCIDPFSSESAVADDSITHMSRRMAAAAAAAAQNGNQDSCTSTDSEPPHQVRSPWARELQRMTGLKTLTMEFEHHAGKDAELRAIAEWGVRAWRFPLADGDGHHRVLVAKRGIERTTWRRPTALLHESEGQARPRMVVFAVSWAAASDETPSVSDPVVVGDPVTTTTTDAAAAAADEM